MPYLITLEDNFSPSSRPNVSTTTLADFLAEKSESTEPGTPEKRSFWKTLSDGVEKFSGMLTTAATRPMLVVMPRQQQQGCVDCGQRAHRGGMILVPVAQAASPQSSTPCQPPCEQSTPQTPQTIIVNNPYPVPAGFVPQTPTPHVVAMPQQQTPQQQLPQTGEQGYQDLPREALFNGNYSDQPLQTLFQLLSPASIVPASAQAPFVQQAGFPQQSALPQQQATPAKSSLSQDAPSNPAQGSNAQNTNTINITLSVPNANIASNDDDEQTTTNHHKKNPRSQGKEPSNAVQSENQALLERLFPEEARGNQQFANSPFAPQQLPERTPERIIERIVEVPVEKKVVVKEVVEKEIPVVYQTKRPPESREEPQSYQTKRIQEREEPQSYQTKVPPEQREEQQSYQTKVRFARATKANSTPSDNQSEKPVRDPSISPEGVNVIASLNTLLSPKTENSSARTTRTMNDRSRQQKRRYW